MSKRSKYSAEEKYEILKEYENRIVTVQKIALKYQIDRQTLQEWKSTYEKYGLDGLKESEGWKRYSKELKENAVKDYLSEEYSQREIIRKYEISGRTVLKQWVNKYNSHRELKSTVKGMNRSMTKGRSTTWKERIEIVLYCITESKDYQKAAEVYHVSYQQVYQWVKKYEMGGQDALKDRRGLKKDQDELTSEDKVNLEMKRLQGENERLRAENAFLKKLEELERGRF